MTMRGSSPPTGFFYFIEKGYLVIALNVGRE
nr:MAG TPA: hypothetical protein [Caudoviricetes sp.]